MADRKENELTKANDFAYVRALDSNGNSIQISKSDLVSVLEGLLPEATKDKKGLMPINFSKFLIDNIFPNVERNKLYKAFNLKQYGLGVLVLLYGSVTNNINTVMFLLNNRSQGSLSVMTKKIITTDSSQYTIYAKYNSDNSIDVYFKGYNDAYVTLEYFG